MIKIIPLFVVCIALSACGNHSQEPVDHTHETVKTTGVARGNSVFPDGIKPAFLYKIRSKGTAQASTGQVRKLVVEFEKTDAKVVDKELESALVAKGFKRYKNEISSDGGLVGDYGKTGHRVTTTTTSAKNSKLNLAADSAGTVYFVWH
jgi:hypothetical protein